MSAHRFNFIFLTFFLTFKLIAQDWTQVKLPSPYGYFVTYKSIFFNNPQVGYITGNIYSPNPYNEMAPYLAGGIVVKTTDGGNSWNYVTIPKSSEINAISVSDQQILLIVGENGSIYRSIDAGKNWSKIGSGNSENLKSIFFATSKIGFIVGSNCLILKTKDGGLSWERKFGGNNITLQSAYFIDSMIGYCVGSGGLLLKTADGGESWERIELPTKNNLFDVFFTDRMNGVVAGIAAPPILRTTDGGLTWKQSAVENESFYSIYFTNKNTGYGIGTGNDLYMTNDGGKSWPFKKEISMYGGIKRRVYFPSDKTGYIITSNIVYRCDLPSINGK